MLARASLVTPAMCGLTSTLSNCSSGWSRGGGSFVQHVEAGAGDGLAPQRVGERLLVVDEAAAGGDEERVRLHERELARAEHAARLLGERAVGGHEVGA